LLAVDASALGLNMHSTARLAPVRSSTVRSSIRMQLDLSSLSARIAEVSSKAEPDVVRVMVLESMVPGQRLALERDDYWAPKPLVTTLDLWRNSMNQSIVMVGHDESGKLNSHGVEVTLERNEDCVGNTLRADGSARIELVAGRYAEVIDMGPDEGGYLRAGAVNWLDLSDSCTAPEEQPTESLLERADELEGLVVEWMQLVRSAGKERVPRQLERIMLDLKQMPPATLPSARALWVSGLINPLPALGVALEIRPSVLTAQTAELRVLLAEAALKHSIERLRSDAPRDRDEELD